MKIICLAVSAALAVSPAFAQEPLPLPVKRVGDAPSGNAVLPANTEITLRMNQEVTTKGKTWSEGDQFKLTVAEDVTLGEYVVILQHAVEVLVHQAGAGINNILIGSQGLHFIILHGQWACCL